MRILFLLPVPSQVRYQKRVYSLVEQGAESCVMSFEREYYQGNPWKDGYINLGEINHQSYLERIIPLIKAVRLIREELKTCDVIYVFGLDMLLLRVVSRIFQKFNQKIVYEVGDLRDIQLNKGILSSLTRMVERWLLGHIDHLVVTSPGFIEGYYKTLIDLDQLPHQIIENKVLPGWLPVVDVEKNRNGKRMIIGYYGLLRDTRSWAILKQIVKRGNGQIGVYLRGIPMGLPTFFEDVQKTDFLQYQGEYVYPDELSEIYNNADIIWACYPFQESDFGNWNFARTNRFYEACYFKKPIISQSGTLDSQVVDKYQIGLSLDLGEIEESINKVLSLDSKKLYYYRENMNSVPENLYTYTDEHQELYRVLK